MLKSAEVIVWIKFPIKNYIFLKNIFFLSISEAVDHRELCTVKLSSSDLEQLRSAIEDLFYFEFVLDDLPLRGFVGHLEESGFVPHRHKVFLWTHIHFLIEFNKNQVCKGFIQRFYNRVTRFMYMYEIEWVSEFVINVLNEMWASKDGITVSDRVESEPLRWMDSSGI